MKREKPYIYKRVIAFIIDTLIVTVLSGLLTIVFTNSDKYNEDNKKLLELTEKIVSEKQDQDKYMKEFKPTTFTPRANDCNLTSGPTAALILSIVSKAFSLQ